MYKQRKRDEAEECAYKKTGFIPSAELDKSYGMLLDRVKKDKLYKRHMERLARGTEKEKDEEIKKSNEGYYQTHYEEGGMIKVK